MAARTFLLFGNVTSAKNLLPVLPVIQGKQVCGVVAEFNYYNRHPQILLQGEETGERRLTGVFDADAPESLILFFQGAREFDVNRGDDIVVIRKR